MNFLYPDWFYALIFIPLILIGAILMRSNRSNIWKKMVGTKHQKQLIKSSSKLWSWISFSISLVALTGFIIAMTRPYQGQTEVRDKVNTRNVIIAVDCSLSMLCMDGDTANTDRLSTAKATAIKLVDAFPDDHIGVMAFAGSANMISSITIDHPSVKQAIDQIDIYSAHTRGSNFSSSVIKSIEALKSAGKSANALILITDGTEDKPDISDLAKRAKNAEVQIFTIGVGTTAGGTIPIQMREGRMTQHKDQYGRVVITKLIDSPLRQLAIETSGSYSNASNANEMIVDAVNKMKQFEKEGRVREVPHELYQWFLAPSILLLIISVMLKANWKKTISGKTATASILVFTLLLPSQSEAQESDSFAQQTKMALFDKPAFKRAGYKALENKKYPEAILYLVAARSHSDGEEHAELSLALAQALYRNGDFSKATKAYGDAMISSDQQVQIDAQYNMGNALFRTAVASFDPPENVPFEQYLEDTIRGGAEIESIKTTLKNSISKYTETLNSESTHSQATKNKFTAEKLLKSIEDIQEKIRKEEEEKKKQKEEKKKEGKEDEDKKEEDKKDEDKKDEDKGENPEEEKEDSENKKSEDNGDEPEDKSEEMETKEGDSSDEPKEKTESGKEGQPEDTGKETESTQGDPEKLKPSKLSKAQEKGEFETEEEAREFMKRMSAERKKPIRQQRGWRSSSVDW